MDEEKPKMVPIGEYMVGTLIHAGVVKPEDGPRAIEIVEDELGVWLAIEEFNN
jgi:hypothetical protein